MYKHILIPTDGSELSLRAAKAGIELAKLCKAKVTAIQVVAPYQAIAYMGSLLAATEFAYNEQAQTNAEHYLDEVKAMAEAQGVAFDSEILSNDQPWEAIVKTVASKQCDLIVMGSNGRRGMTRLLLGSETHKVLLRSEVPVLVCH
jgi:nucleotide-binding universal stress UspA family protein